MGKTQRLSLIMYLHKRKVPPKKKKKKKKKDFSSKCKNRQSKENSHFKLQEQANTRQHSVKFKLHQELDQTQSYIQTARRV